MTTALTAPGEVNTTTSPPDRPFSRPEERRRDSVVESRLDSDGVRRSLTSESSPRRISDGVRRSRDSASRRISEGVRWSRISSRLASEGVRRSLISEGSLSSRLLRLTMLAREGVSVRPIIFKVHPSVKG